MLVNVLVNDDVSRWRGKWRHQMTWRMTSPRADVSRRKLARAGACRCVTAREEYWRRVKAHASNAKNSSDAWKVRWRRYFTERQIEEITFRWYNLWSDRRSGSGDGGKAVVFDVLKSWWRQWCCSQQRLQITPKKTRLLKSSTPKD